MIPKYLFKPLSLGLGISTAAALLWWDRHHPEAGLLLLLILTSSLGLVHGAMDVLLITGHAHNIRSRLKWLGCYLLASLLTAYALAPTPSWTLLVLLLLSAWHFGEPFGQAPIHSRTQRGLTRWVRGGAPVMLPALLQRPALHELVTGLVGPDAHAITIAWTGWSILSSLWLTALAIHLAWTWWPRTKPKIRDHHMILEPALLAMLYSAVSPLMGFALFFGLYHAGGHIQRVMQSRRTPTKTQAHHVFLIATIAITTLLASILTYRLHQFSPTLSLPDWALRSTILTLTAVSVPHVVLITWWARQHGTFPKPKAPIM
jgi:beta-carotene 15,15'-dioxygenase